jgi:hypothetical protein
MDFIIDSITQREIYKQIISMMILAMLGCVACVQRKMKDYCLKNWTHFGLNIEDVKEFKAEFDEFKANLRKELDRKNIYFLFDATVISLPG